MIQSIAERFSAIYSDLLQSMSGAGSRDCVRIPGGSVRKHQHLQSMKQQFLHGRLAVVALLLTFAQAGLAQPGQHAQHTLPMVKPASDAVLQGFIRIINHSNHDGTVQIHGIDDSGERFGPVTLEINAKASRHLNSADLESGNDDKGLSGGLGDGDGNWRLELETTLDIEPLAYIRTADGFVTSMHDLVARGAPRCHHVPFFNPGSNEAQVSLLRLINKSDTENEVTLVGLDDDGERADGAVLLTLPAGGVRTVSAQELESGGNDLTGTFGDGVGKWHLFVSSEHPVELVNMLRSPTGHLTNLSTSISYHNCDSTDVVTPEIERAALLALYNATDGTNWAQSENWLSGRPVGEWYGVTTEADGA